MGFLGCLVFKAGKIRIRAEHRACEILRETPKIKGAKGIGTSALQALKDTPPPFKTWASPTTGPPAGRIWPRCLLAQVRPGPLQPRPLPLLAPKTVQLGPMKEQDEGLGVPLLQASDPLFQEVGLGAALRFASVLAHGTSRSRAPWQLARLPSLP